MLICQAAANKTCYRSFQSFFQFLQTKQVKRLFTTGKVFSFDKKGISSAELRKATMSLGIVSKVRWVYSQRVSVESNFHD